MKPVWMVRSPPEDSVDDGEVVSMGVSSGVRWSPSALTMVPSNALEVLHDGWSRRSDPMNLALDNDDIEGDGLTIG